MHETRISPGIAEITPAMIELRRALHAQPELGYEEFLTRERVVELLRKWGYEVHLELAETAVVASLHNGHGPSLGLRAELDALPITEQGEHPWRSRTPGKMHACGHDGHIAMLLAAACELARNRCWRGTLHLFFQPAEEGHGGSGAKRMLEENVFELFPCDGIFALHNSPGMPVGRFGVLAGPCMASTDNIVILIEGVGGHGAMPHKSVDPVVIGSSLVMALQSLVSRNVPPSDMAIVTVGAFLAGDAANVIPQQAELRLSVRALRPEVRQMLRARIQSLAELHAGSFGAKARVIFGEGYPVLVNDQQASSLAAGVIRDWLGENALVQGLQPICASDDFAYWLERVPGCYLLIGNGDGAGSCEVHHPEYDFNDQILPLGASFWVRLAERFLA
ncbi:M20 aminoacylase family protein [Pseudomonas sessilinigenes]|uniref:Amidohydrolase n=1 Tax=Pseudomonas sessilinigenes TaxID=658629 RepID=A0ABX8MX28_9PSED|nr:M20 aminoacylase family protein [Pseudomonas sessilinigenes]AZC24699.1 Catalyzes the cleavage of p-aminobenzoyl-glutamate to p-aminobenzoate and glutamate, subunit A [Pseudomonas sessilinigenes]QXH43622.1 amidohydrolase [Pseudomonas sessilinigenes]